MSPAKDNDYFGDGTQAASFDDPLSSPARGAEDDEFTLTRVASPVRPDSTRVQALVDAELGKDRPPEFSDVIEVEPPDTTPPGSPAQAIPPAPPLGILPRQRSRPGLRSVSGLRGMKRPQLRMPRLGSAQPGTIRRTRPSAGSTGVIVAVLLVIVFAIVAIEFLASLISSISGLFN
ncbi:MAG TPA: hypothetical protein VHC18_16235 [Amycolatopsis sp.]|nr:hypothetical protein [Amycolatopsis sp.]